jgi:hypothetical protein
MSVLGNYGASALKYWGSILASAYANKSTADMWTAIHAQKDEYGLDKPGTQPPDVSVLRGYANRIVNAAGNLAAASPSDSITPDMMAIAPYTASTLDGIATNPTYHVRFLNTIQADDGTVTQVWNTSVFTAVDMPTTVGDLTDAITTNGTELAAQGVDGSSNTPRGTSLTISNLEITVI